MRIIAGKYKGRKINRPSLTQTRPTTDQTRESIFNILSTFLEREGMAFENLNVLDVFAGSGALGFEALSRGAPYATFMEWDNKACHIIAQNAKHLTVINSVSILQGDARHPMTADRLYNLIFLDPPYNKGLITPVLNALKKKKWVGENAIIIMELSSEEANPETEGFDILLERVYGSTKVLIGRCLS